MVANPMQKIKRNSTLIGVIIGLVIALLIGAIIYVMFLQPIMDKANSQGGTLTSVAVLNKPIKSGAEITAADYTIRTVNSEVVPADAIGGIAPKTEDNKEIVTVAKIDLSAGTVLSSSIITTSDSKLTKDLRTQEYNMIVLPSKLLIGDYIDIRLQLPDGGDYIVISKKCVQNANTSSVWLNMTEEETLVMSNAIIEYYIMTGSKLYATIYTDPGSQEAAIPTYSPNSDVVDLINGNKNITSQIVDGEGRFSQALKNIRNNNINTELKKYDDTELGNIETKLQDEINKLKEAREAYFGALNAAQ